MSTTQTTFNKKKNTLASQQHKDLESMTDQIRDRYEDLIENASETSKSSVSFIKKYPFYALASVVAIGAAATIYLKSRRSSL
jgi:ElaB/YqjD/DUF883 family membrane-anchored ribosome-binding protein